MLQHVGVVFYTKPQVYQCSYQVRLKNVSKQQKKVTLVIPIVSEHQNQKLQGSPKFSVSSFGSVNMDILHDDVFGNRYSVLPIQLEAGQEELFSEDFRVEVSPARTSKSLLKFYLKDYEALEPALYKTFLKDNSYIDSKDPEIVALVNKIRGTHTDVLKVVRAINIFVVKYLEYGTPIPGLYRSEVALRERKVDCGGFDTFFIALCNALGVPARVVSGFWAGYDKNLMHAWAEFLVPDGTWVPVDPSMEQFFMQGKSRKSGRFGFTGSDRVILSKGCDIPVIVNGQKVMIDILQNPYLIGDEIDIGVNFITKTL